MQSYLYDLRYSLRALRRSPGLALMAVTALAMGIGFTTTMFSIVRGGTRSLPFDQPDELMAVAVTLPGSGRELWPETPTYLAWTRQLSGFEGLGAYQSVSVNISGDADRPERRPATYVTARTFPLLGERPAMGRDFAPADGAVGAPAVAMLGHDLWRARFEGDPDIVGSVIRIDSRAVTVIGVMPPRFGFPINSDLWLPLHVAESAAPGGAEQVQVFGRLHNGVSAEEAGAQLGTIAERVAMDTPGPTQRRTIRVFPFAETETPPEMVTVLYLMVGAVSFVLLIACANVASLLLARAANRARDTAIRAALGANRRRIVTLQLAESVILSIVGGLLGLGMAHFGVRFFGLMTSDILEAFWMDFRVDTTVVAFATGLIMIAAVAAGIIPALRASKTDVAEVLKDQATSSTGLRMGKLARALVIGEVALATGFLITTVTFVKSAVGVRAVALPFETRDVFAAQLGLRDSILSDPDRRARFAVDLSERLQAIRGVTSAALISVVPGRGAGNTTFAMDGQTYDRPQDMPTTGVVSTTPEFLEVLQARVVRGRSLTWQDTRNAPLVAVVNVSFVARFSADRDPIGRTVRLGSRDFTVVGVVPDLQMQDFDDRRADGFYVSMLQARPYVVRVLVRSAGDPAALSRPVWDAVAAIDADVPLFEAGPLRDAMYADTKVLDTFAALFLAFGAGALFLTVVGLYGIVSFAVARRTREIGLRVALGARPKDVVRLVLRQGATEVGAGTAIGLFIAFALAKGLSSAIDIIEPANPVMYVAVVSILVTAAMVGLAVPVRRALALEPAKALRME